jgi:hypothetical protein
MKRTIITLGVGLFACWLQGCSTQVHVSPLQADLKPGEPVNGLPFRTRERYQVTLYKLEGVTYVPLQTQKQVELLANVDHLHVLRVKGAALSDGTVTVKMRQDNTLESVRVESKSKGQEALTALGKGLKDVGDAKTARDKADTAEDKAAEGEVVAEEDKRYAALEARQAADLAVVELTELPATATQAQRTAAEQKVVKLKLAANQKARRAGLQPPFADSGG